MIQHIVYKTTNLINNKIYIGYHKLITPEKKCYYGSNKHLKKAIKKYGKKNFKREILFTFTTKEEALQKEAELVNEAWIKQNNTYNQALGGCCPPNKTGCKESKDTCNLKSKISLEKWQTGKREHVRELLRKKWQGSNNIMHLPEVKEKNIKNRIGQKRTEASKEKMRKAWTAERKKEFSSNCPSRLPKNKEQNSIRMKLQNPMHNPETRINKLNKQLITLKNIQTGITEQHIKSVWQKNYNVNIWDICAGRIKSSNNWTVV